MGKSSAGGSSRMSGRGGSSLISAASATSARTASADIADLRRFGSEQYVSEVSTGFGRHSDPHLPALLSPLQGGISCCTLTDAVSVMVSYDDDFPCHGWQDQRSNPI